jgi:hypothetical protein
MALPQTRSSRHATRLDGYTYRRSLAPRELLPAIGVGVAAGIVAFYVARLLLQRTPLNGELPRPGKRHVKGRAAG